MCVAAETEWAPELCNWVTSSGQHRATSTSDQHQAITPSSDHHRSFSLVTTERSSSPNDHHRRTISIAQSASRDHHRAGNSERSPNFSLPRPIVGQQILLSSEREFFFFFFFLRKFIILMEPSKRGTDSFPVTSSIRHTPSANAHKLTTATFKSYCASSQRKLNYLYSSAVH